MIKSKPKKKRERSAPIYFLPSESRGRASGFYAGSPGGNREFQEVEIAWEMGRLDGVLCQRNNSVHNFWVPPCGMNDCG